MLCNITYVFPLGQELHRYTKTDVFHKRNLCISPMWILQVYNTLSRSYPRRFVFPLNVTNETPMDKNLNTRANSKATCVKVNKDKVS